MLAHRLKQARLRAGLSQEKLGKLAGIDPMSASARMNQYERGKHSPDFKLMCKVAEILNMIFGQAKKTLNDSGMDIKSAIPTVIRGAGHCLENHAHHPTIVIPFSSPETGPFRSEVSTAAISI